MELFESILIAETAPSDWAWESSSGCGQTCNPASRWMSSVSISELSLAGLSERPIIGYMNFRFVEVLIGGFSQNNLIFRVLRNC